jgi:glycerol uptake facilitator protein
MNRPTTNSIYRSLSGELMAEFLGTLVPVLFGNGCVATFLLFPTTLSNVKGTVIPDGLFLIDWSLVAFGRGFAVMLGIYAAGLSAARTSILRSQ